MKDEVRKEEEQASKVDRRKFLETRPQHSA